MDKKLLGKRINIARKDRKFTGEKLAEACNINATYLRQIEAGTKVPSMPVFVTICRELKVSPSYLLADVLAESNTQDMEHLFSLWMKATPSQIQLINALTKAALDFIEG